MVNIYLEAGYGGRKEFFTVLSLASVYRLDDIAHDPTRDMLSR